MSLKRTAVALLDGMGAGDRVRTAIDGWRRRQHRRGSPGLVRDYLGRTPAPKLHIGASNKPIDGWLNTDIERHAGVAYLDCTAPFPFAAESFDYAFCEHFIEHLDQAEGLACMTEVHRCLKPGGVFRLATPDLEKYVGLFAPSLDAEQRRYLDQFRDLFGMKSVNACEVLNLAMHSWGHKFLYTRAELGEALRQSGFARIETAEVSQSRHEALRGVERHQEFCGEAMNRFETFVLEAVK